MSTRLALLAFALSPLPAFAQSQTSSAAIELEEREPGHPRSGTRVEEDAPAAKPAQHNDHELVVGRFGVGWFGVSNIPTSFAVDGTGTGGVVAAPVLGVRYWFTHFIGLDVGLGLALSGSTAETTNNGTTLAESDGPSTFGVLLHAGVPMAFKSGKHYSFILVPELNVGSASITRKVNDGMMNETELETTGFRLDLGARAGAEIQFGFIDIPELALEASVGVYLTRVQARREEQAGVFQSVGQTSITTTSLNNPWDFFRTTVAARYYF